jgi:hypothetical protein
MAVALELWPRLSIQAASARIAHKERHPTSTQRKKLTILFLYISTLLSGLEDGNPTETSEHT